MRTRLLPMLAAVLTERTAAAAEADAAAARALDLAGDPAAERDEATHQLYTAITQRLGRAADELRAAVQEMDYRARQTAAVALVTTERQRMAALQDELTAVTGQLADERAAREQLQAAVVVLQATVAAASAPATAEPVP